MYLVKPRFFYQPWFIVVWPIGTNKAMLHAETRIQWAIWNIITDSLLSATASTCRFTQN